MAKSIDYSLGPHTFPRGWFVIAESSELNEKPLALRFFAKDFALYRGESGNPVLLDAYCPHMGTHIAASDTAVLAKQGLQIEGDSIRCPYHGWRFNSDGQCDNIPYQEAPYPRSAKINSYPVVEVMGCIMMWHDEAGEPPHYAAPELPEWQDPDWVQWQLDHCGELPVHPQEIIDNMADIRHLEPTHGAHCEYFENEIDEHICIQRQAGFHDDYNSLLQTITWYTGPGVLLSKQDFGDTSSYEFIANTPVEDGITKVWHGVLYKCDVDKPESERIEAARSVQQLALEILAADFSVWLNKNPATRILQLKNDGPFNICRQWYSQFYMPAPQVENVITKIQGKHFIGSVKSFADIAIDKLANSK